MKTDELRERFLAFFESKGHTRYPSDSLVPSHDPSLLFTGAGMNQFKDMFLGKGNLPFSRATTSQKCLRTADIENVGKTAAHHTFFEMLGNFSFGDYFKKDAIAWAWEFVTNVLGIPPERLKISIYKEDDEAFDIWRNDIGIASESIVKLDAHSNFWPADAPERGPNGPCGPCSELYFDWGEGVGCGRPDCNVDCECDRFVEIWNLVFMQFERKDGGVLEPLPRKNVDTGAGLERVASVLQGVKSNFEIDTLAPIVAETARILGKDVSGDKSTDSLLRRITDHVRAVIFCIADGVLPSNEGRGYVERRLLRRALLDAQLVGFQGEFLYKLVPLVADIMKGTYPEVRERRENIARIIKAEESRFLATLAAGLALIEDITKHAGDRGEKIVSVDRTTFEKKMESQRLRARSASNIAEDIFDDGVVGRIKELTQQTEFTGYRELACTSPVIAIAKGDVLVDEAGTGDEIKLVTERTPLYAESGGQVGDRGTARTENGEVEIYDVKKHDNVFVHHGTVRTGSITTGETVTMTVDRANRMAIARNHTATHVLHQALRTVLGEHAEQSGSLVTPERLRLDFTHFEAVKQHELERVEKIVNEKIMENLPVSTKLTSLDEAKREGAMALFGEKYGSEVRFVAVGDFSRELCGGTHLASTGEIGFFKIISEESIAAGVRRIEAVTGTGAWNAVREESSRLRELSVMLKASPDKIVSKLQALVETEKDLRKEIDKLKKARVQARQADLALAPKEINGFAVVAGAVPDASIGDLRYNLDAIKKQMKSYAVLLAGTKDGRVSVLLAISNDYAAKGLHAGNLLKKVAGIMGGKGGGRPEMAQGGGGDPAKIPEAIAQFEKLLGA